ncbi:MAG: RHS repeat-associated core domain-containing protein [Oscillospiraceae bacterium]
MAAVNPLQYRGYYHDSETGFYYLQSRYYDPEICRFINADSYASTGQSYLGYNTFAYCGNDPVNRTDADGEFWDTVFDIVSLGFSIADVIQNPSDPWAWAGLVGDVVDLVPFVTGVGELTKAAGAVADVADVIDDVHDTARALDNADDVYDAVKPQTALGIFLMPQRMQASLIWIIVLPAGQCFVAGTLVLTENGNQAIETSKLAIWSGHGMKIQLGMFR